VFRIVNLESGAVEHTVAPPVGTKLRDVGWADDGRPYYTASAALGEMKAIVTFDAPALIPRRGFHLAGNTVSSAALAQPLLSMS
jgi:hypothetical protein